jgi:hypothetical protein
VETSSVTAPAGSILALWLAGGTTTPSVSGLSLSWTEKSSVADNTSGWTNPQLVLFTAEVGATEVSGTVTATYTGEDPLIAFDLDCASGDDGETLTFGASAVGAVTNVNSNYNTGTATLTFPAPSFYILGSCANSEYEMTATPGESPAWTQLALVESTLGLETQVSPDTSDPNAQVNWSGWYSDTGGWAVIGIPVTAS